MTDPLKNNALIPNRQRELFDRLAGVCSGFAAEDVIGAALNLVINAERQTHSTWRAVEQSFDEMVARAKGVLREHYSAAGGRRNVFPFTQNIDVPFIRNKTRIWDVGPTVNDRDRRRK